MGKKYFIFSDVHGFYDELMKSLNEKGFDINNPEHIIISCGDIMDRGPKPLECLKFVNELPDNRKILIKGNHEWLFKDIYRKKFFDDYDSSNVTRLSYISLYESNVNKKVNQELIHNYELIMSVNEIEDVEKYFKSLVDYYETEHHIFIHSWIPQKKIHEKQNLRNANYGYDENWRNANEREWDNARWKNPFEKATNPENLVDNKTFVFGHWHTSWARRYLDGHKNDRSYEFGDNTCFDIYHGKQFIGLDGCTAYSGQVNVLVLDENEI